ncbi:MAG: hypothetical protein ACLFR0_06740 [Alphaproteobacteria bacterium]
MRCFLTAIAILFGLTALAAPFKAQAQKPDIVSEAICFQVRNSMDFTMLGSIGTNYYTTPQGTKARHRSNFRLQPAGSIDEQGYPADRAEFCSYGPFYADRKLELTIRTLFPVFSCMTRIDQGEIVLRADRNESDSGYNYYADCYE